MAFGDNKDNALAKIITQFESDEKLAKDSQSEYSALHESVAFGDNKDNALAKIITQFESDEKLAKDSQSESDVEMAKNL